MLNRKQRRNSEFEKEAIRKSKKEYLNTYNNTRREIIDLYLDYGDRGIIRPEEARKYNRLANTESRIRGHIAYMYNKNGTDLRKDLYDVYNYNYYMSGYNIEQNYVVDEKYKKLDKDHIKDVIQSEISGASLNHRLTFNKNKLQFEVIRDLNRGINNSINVASTIRQIRDTLDKDFKRHKTTIITETNRVANVSDNDMYIYYESKGYKIRRAWIAVLDEKTRDSHRELNGQKEDSEGYFHIRGRKTKAPGQFGIASEDINCRCTTRLELDAEVRKDGFTDVKKWLNDKSITIYI